jgi:ABC-type uncharacterized transport system substrate-binding protein
MRKSTVVLLVLTVVLFTAAACASGPGVPLAVGTGVAASEAGVTWLVGHGGLSEAGGNLLLSFIHDIANGITLLSPKVQAMQEQLTQQAQQIAAQPSATQAALIGGGASTAASTVISHVLDGRVINQIPDAAPAGATATPTKA